MTTVPEAEPGQASQLVTQAFTGQEADGSTAALDFYNARHFSAVLASFVQPDPYNAGADILNPQSWNGYGYVLGNPLGLVDPSGMFASTDHPPCYAATGTTTITGGSRNPDYATTANPYNDGFLTFLANSFAFLSGGTTCTNCGGNSGSTGSGNPAPAKNGTRPCQNADPNNLDFTTPRYYGSENRTVSPYHHIMDRHVLPNSKPGTTRYVFGSDSRASIIQHRQ